jgi:ferredoxin--NADP+ reductase
MDVSNATIVDRVDLTGDIAHFEIRPDDGPPAFEPGQYLALGLPIGERLVQRPYSTASRKDTPRDVEFFIRRVPGGLLTSRLWEVAPGARVRLGRPKGLFTLLPGDGRAHLFVASGTGLAPFISMLELLFSRVEPPRVVVLHGASYVRELGYRERLERWVAEGRPLAYLPTISRPADPLNAGWSGRTGRAAVVIDAACEELDLDPRGTVAYLCGNPEMIASGERRLLARGVPREAIRSEQYWPQAAA